MLLLPSTKNSETKLDGSQRPAVAAIELPHAVMVRGASATDESSIRRLARLDDRRMPHGPFLVAEQDDEVVAAVSLSTGGVVADPFRRTGDAAELLRLRSAQIAARAA